VAAAIVVAAVLGSVLWRPLSARVQSVRLAIAMESVRLVAASPRYPARLSGPRSGTWQATLAGKMIASHPNEYEVANGALTLAEMATGDEAARARGAALFIGRDCRRSVAAFLSVRDRDARDWNDLAAAQLCVAAEHPGPDRWLDALVSVDHALGLAPLAEARFNREQILESIGVPRAVRSRGLPRAERDFWRAATTKDFERMDTATLDALTVRYPEAARRFTEGFYLGQWAEMVKRRQTVAAARLYERIGVIARTLERETGEGLLAETIRTIDRRGPDPSLLDGLIAYRDGRYVLSQHDPAGGEPILALAEARLRSAGCPLAEMARFFRATAIQDQNRPDEALEVLRGVDLRVASRQALSAHVHYQIALIEAVRGLWSAALADAKTSLDRFSALHEGEYAAAAGAAVSEDYDLIGQPALALDHGVAALRVACATGDVERVRIALAVLCRTAFRAGDFERARSLTLIEDEFAPLEKIPHLDPDMFLRRATAEWHLGNASGARDALAHARTAAAPFGDEVKRKLLADVDAAEGSFLGRTDPPRAIALLSSAIAFHQASARPIVLPELYLQRGRVRLAAKQLALAALDFDSGIAELERQRTHVADAELRPGIFDDAAALFDEAIALRLDRETAAEDVFAYVERGRARAMLEQLYPQDDAGDVARNARIEDIQRELNPGSVLVEYASLPDRLIAFIISAENVSMRTIPVTRDALRTAARAFTASGGADGNVLHAMLIAPLQEELRGAKAINFVADDTLQRVPFTALIDGGSQKFLIERYVVATSPSAGVYLATRREGALPTPSAMKTLVFGNPTIPRDEFGDLPSLIASEHEAASVARRYPRADLFVGDDATAERFIQLAPQYNVVYFAGHGVLNRREPYASALVCAATSRRRGGLTVREIVRMRFPSTRVVVLAACSTMAAREAAVEGGTSLSRAFIVAGVPAVIGTLWDVDDDKVAAIARPLHEALARGITPAAALRAAQVAAIRQHLPTAQWSAFAVMGSD
jgi:CHAT domain-containing protein